MNYIAVDCHISTLDFAVVNERGKITKKKRIATSAKGLIEVIKEVPRPRQVIIEEGSLAAWILEICTKYKEKLIITDPKINRWIGLSKDKDDDIDARKLAQLARGGYIKEIHHRVGDRRRFRELVLAYHDTVRSETRIKNKLKSKFRQNGIQCTGETVYLGNHRESWRKKLPRDKIVHLIVSGLWEQLDQIQAVKEEIVKKIKTQSKKYSEIKRFKKVPGIGPIHGATISAILETPERFANKKKVWMYAGLGIVRKRSGGKLYSEQLTMDYNRVLKYSLKQAAESAIVSKDNQFRRQYLRLTMESGIPSHRAKLTVSRSILSTLYGIWKSGKEYAPDLKQKNKEREQTS